MKYQFPGAGNFPATRHDGVWRIMQNYAIFHFLLCSFLSLGTKVGLVDTNNRVQAWSIVRSQTTVHGKPLEQGHISEVLPSCQLKPPCPGTFDDPDQIHTGEFHSWPLSSIALPFKPS